MASITNTGPALNSAGIGSGLDVNSIVTKLMSIEAQPVTDLQQATTKLQTKISSYGQIQSAISAMQDAARKLNTPETWAAATATSSDSSTISVAATSAAPGSYSVSVSQLASAQSLSSASYTNSSTVVGQGSITIEPGTWSSDQSTFTSKSGATPVTINIASGQDSLSAIRDQINAAKAGVTASIVTDSKGARLVLRSQSTGETSGFKVSVSDADGGDGDTAGLSALAYDPTASVASMTLNQSAANAKANINGLDIDSESNTLSTSVDGLSINLLKTSSSPITISVGSDSAGLKKNITDFVTAYNSVAKLFRDQTKYDSANKTAGALQGDSRVVGLQSQLRSLTGSSTSLGGAFSRVADIGLDPAGDGTLTLNSSKLDKALTNLTDLKQFFTGVDSSNATNNGFAQRWNKFASDTLGTDGLITTGQKALQSNVTRNNDRISQLQDHLALVEKRLRAQYTSLDTTMGKMNQLSAYVTQQFSTSSK
ncbi:flagellar filament capping protein FliD [Paucibacter sp. APW11]|uniref:Flagellar hook-associated protein 2 n=1 Tax=Roseateles aquae TaxID=3077235 RepID=A0ABU3P9U1_9BURK|nr:flagellar filament capping protein FliD [Paucibacter sp. APW11]MDT8999342.1 flagellar filament capping protein FliD [Paucibacter sp. APW11]